MTVPPKYWAFTLIELLIVVAIIAILAAIAIPNFMEAQTRSKSSRARADMRSLAIGIESYATDNNAFPPGYKTAPRDGLIALTTPIPYIGNAYPLDPFRPLSFQPSKSSYTYELMNVNNKIIEKGGGAFSVDPANPGDEPFKGTWWWLASRGPNNTFGLKPGEPEYNLKQSFFEAENNSEALINSIYDPTNGSQSSGNLYRVGGAVSAVYSTLLNR